MEEGYEVVVRPSGGASISISSKADTAGAQKQTLSIDLLEWLFRVPDQCSRQGIKRGL